MIEELTTPRSTAAVAAVPGRTAPRARTLRGRSVLMMAHCAGMVDLVALPVWVGTLIGHYRLDPQQAGALATMFLGAAVASSLFFAPRFNRLNTRLAAALGFGLAAVAFIALSRTTAYGAMAALHLIGGAAVGCGLSVTHGTIGRSHEPHRLFALVGMALGVFALLFLALTPQVMAVAGGPALFVVFGGVMALAAVASALAFPGVEGERSVADASPGARSAGAAAPTSFAPAPAAAAHGHIPVAAWFVMLGVGCMALTQAMMFSFVERIGIDHGFGASAVMGVLIAIGAVNLVPAPLAAWLEHRWQARRVLLAGPALQGLLAVPMATSMLFAPYAVVTAVYAGVMIFTHTFAFGLLSRLDRSGRAAAATPAMLMIGAACGPILGGTLVKAQGYGSLAVAAALVSATAIFFFSRVAPRPLPVVLAA